ncbi:phosphotransferase [Alkalihalobacillus sp. FSL W8-0930]
MSKSNKFFHTVNNLYIKENLKIFILLKMLYTKGNTFNFGRKPINKKWKIVPSRFIKFIRITRVIYNYYNKSSSDYIETADGENCHVGIKLRKGGYKLFDLKKNEVYTFYETVFSFNEQRNINVQIDDLNITPRIIESNQAKLLIVEEYINGTQLKRLNIDWHLSNEILINVFDTVLNYRKKKQVNYQDYILMLEDRNKNILNRKKFIQYKTSNICYMISDLLNQVKENYKKNVDVNTIDLYFTHGDLSEVNMLIDQNNKIYLIDWETMGFRTQFFDLLTLYYKTLEFADRPSHQKFKFELRNSMSKLSEKRGIKNKLNLIEIDLFFKLEFITLIIEELEIIEDSDIFKDRFEHLERWIVIFKEYSI